MNEVAFTLAKQHFLNGLAAMESQQYLLAEEQFALSLGYCPDRPSTLVNLQVVSLKLGKLDEVFALAEKILAISPDSPDAYLNLGNAARQRGETQIAVTAYQNALKLDPTYVVAWNNLSIVLKAQNNLAEAEAGFKKALALDPQYAEAHNNLGIVYYETDRYADSLHEYLTAISLDPSNPDFCNNLGNLYLETRQFDRAVSTYQTAFDMDPSIPWLWGRLMSSRCRICDWAGFSEFRDQIIQGVTQSRPVSIPLDFLPLTDSLEEQKACAMHYVHDKYPESHVKKFSKYYQHERIRIGYMSSNFGAHAVSYLVGGMISAHDRHRFEIIGLDTGVEDRSEMRKSLLHAFDQWCVLKGMSDDDASALIRDLEIDILVDLNGHTTGARTGILRQHPASVLVTHLGYPGTSGAGFIDYLIGDPVLIPPECQLGYSEKIVYLPDSFQANDANRQIASGLQRSDFGLDENVFVFGCFNQAVKITPVMFELWMSLLVEVPNSVLWLIREHDQQIGNLREYAERFGVNPNRLVFAGHMSYAEHLARYALMDLALDTLPFNGGTTTSDALWGGVPVITCVGNTYAGRMSASLLTAIGLPELIVSSMDDYKLLAVSLATQPGRLSEIRCRLHSNRQNAPLFDTVRYTRNIENAYEKMLSRYQAGLEPDHIYV